MPSFGRRALNILFAADETINAILGGSPRETISGSVGRAARAGSWWARYLAQPLINAIAGDPNHCQAAAAAEAELRRADPAADPT